MPKTFTFEPITKQQIEMYAKASGDFNRIHLEDAFAKEVGLPSVIAHGMLSMGLLGRALFEWGFPLEKLKNFEAQFKDIVFPGDQLTAKILSQNEETMTLHVINQGGKEILSAMITWWS